MPVRPELGVAGVRVWAAQARDFRSRAAGIVQGVRQDGGRVEDGNGGFCFVGCAKALAEKL